MEQEEKESNVGRIRDGEDDPTCNTITVTEVTELSMRQDYLEPSQPNNSRVFGKCCIINFIKCQSLPRWSNTKWYITKNRLSWISCTLNSWRKNKYKTDL